MKLWQRRSRMFRVEIPRIRSKRCESGVRNHHAMATTITYAGYLADSEDRSIINRRLVSRRRSASFTKSLEKRHDKVVSRRLQRRLERSRHPTRKNSDCSWIQRIYAETPFKSNTVAEINTFEDLSVLTVGFNKNTTNCEQHFAPANTCWRSPTTLKLRNRDFHGHQYDCFSSEACNQPGQGTRSHHEEDEENEEYSALYQTVSSLFQEHHKALAQYREYWPHDVHEG